MAENKFKTEEHEWPKDAEKSGKRWPRHVCMQYIKYLAGQIGLLNINAMELCSKFGISRRTYDRYMVAFYKLGLDKDLVERTKVQLAHAYDFIGREAQSVAIKSTGRVKIAAMKVLLQHSKESAEFLERFELKKPGQISGMPSRIVVELGKEEKEVESEKV